MPLAVRSPRSALITGASRGIGYAIARRLASQGWSLTINARDDTRLADVKAELESAGASVTALAGDVASADVIHALVARHRAVHDTMSALILAAGVGSFGSIDGYPLPRFEKQYAVNMRAPFLLVSESLELLRASARSAPEFGGRVVVLASIEGVYPESGLSAYGMTKAALISLVRSINVEEGHSGITASAISPGFVDTDMSAWTKDRLSPQAMIRVADVVKVVDLVLSVSSTAVVPHVIMSRREAGLYQA